MDGWMSGWMDGWIDIERWRMWMDGMDEKNKEADE